MIFHLHCKFFNDFYRNVNLVNPETFEKYIFYIFSRLNFFFAFFNDVQKNKHLKQWFPRGPHPKNLI